MTRDSSTPARKRPVRWWKNGRLPLPRKGTPTTRSSTSPLSLRPSVTIIDQATGQIKAMVGGRAASKDTSLGLNRAYGTGNTGSKRPPGSAFKTLHTYAPATDAGRSISGYRHQDEPYTLNSGQVLRNAEGNRYRGNRTVRDAITWSVNVCAVKLSDQIGQQLGYDYCENFGISTLVDREERNGAVFTDLTQTLALGGLTDGVYNYELCAAYATIANGGVYNEPMLYSKVLDHDGNVLLDGTGENRTVLKDSTAALLTSAMETLWTAVLVRHVSFRNMPVAGKTGTTTPNKDLWFCGFTPYYTCAVWGGYDDNKECNYDTNFRFRLWKGIMSSVHERLETKEFTMPSYGCSRKPSAVTDSSPLSDYT